MYLLLLPLLLLPLHFRLHMEVPTAQQSRMRRA
jgi:hypothetical protein